VSAFHLIRAVHYGYFRPAGVYEDLSPVDQSALAKYGTPAPAAMPAEATPYPADRLPDVPDGHAFEDGPEGVTVVVDYAQATEELNVEEDPTTRPDDPLDRSDGSNQVALAATNQLSCPAGCRGGKPFKSDSALAKHRKTEKH
jgi:hypothetical protein